MYDRLVRLFVFECGTYLAQLNAYVAQMLKLLAWLISIMACFPIIRDLGKTLEVDPDVVAIIGTQLT
jgi:hypothetical protein